MKMRFFVPLCVLASCLLTHGEESAGDRDALIRVFKPGAAVVLERPFSGTVTLLFPRGLPANAASRSVTLNSLRPEKDGKDDSRIQRYVLADTHNGSSLWHAYLLHDKLPAVERLDLSSCSFEALTGLLGESTCPPKDAGKVDGWDSDVVGWKFFSPRDHKTVDVLEVVVHRRHIQTEASGAKYDIRSYGIYRGTLTISEKAAASDGPKPPN